MDLALNQRPVWSHHWHRTQAGPVRVHLILSLVMIPFPERHVVGKCLKNVLIFLHVPKVPMLGQEPSVQQTVC